MTHTLLLTTLFLLCTILFCSAESPQDVIDNSLKQNKIVVFSKSYCPFCHRVKSIMNQWNVLQNAHVIELNEREDGREIQMVLMERTGSRTVPSIWLDGKFVEGGSDSFMQQVHSGEWEQFLKDNAISYESPRKTEL